MINVGLYYKIKAGREKEFEDTFKGVADMLKGSGAGILDAKLYRDISDPHGEYLIYTEWVDLKAFQNFVTSTAFRHTVDEGKSILESRPRHRVFTELKEEH